MLVKDANNIAKWVSAQTDFPGRLFPAHGPTAIAGGVTMLLGSTTDMYRVWP